MYFSYDRTVRLVKEYHSNDKTVSIKLIENGKKRFHRLLLDDQALGDYETISQAELKFFEACCNIDGIPVTTEQLGLF